MADIARQAFGKAPGEWLVRRDVLREHPLYIFEARHSRSVFGRRGFPIMLFCAGLVAMVALAWHLPKKTGIALHCAAIVAAAAAVSLRERAIEHRFAAMRRSGFLRDIHLAGCNGIETLAAWTSATTGGWPHATPYLVALGTGASLGFYLKMPTINLVCYGAIVGLFIALLSARSRQGTRIMASSIGIYAQDRPVAGAILFLSQLTGIAAVASIAFVPFPLGFFTFAFGCAMAGMLVDRTGGLPEIKSAEQAEAVLEEAFCQPEGVLADLDSYRSLVAPWKVEWRGAGNAIVPHWRVTRERREETVRPPLSEVLRRELRSAFGIIAIASTSLILLATLATWIEHRHLGVFVDCAGIVGIWMTRLWLVRRMARTWPTTAAMENWPAMVTAGLARRVDSFPEQLDPEEPEDGKVAECDLLVAVGRFFRHYHFRGMTLVCVATSLALLVDGMASEELRNLFGGWTVFLLGLAALVRCSSTMKVPLLAVLSLADTRSGRYDTSLGIAYVVVALLWCSLLSRFAPAWMMPVVFFSPLVGTLVVLIFGMWRQISMLPSKGQAAGSSPLEQLRDRALIALAAGQAEDLREWRRRQIEQWKIPPPQSTR